MRTKFSFLFVVLIITTCQAFSQNNSDTARKADTISIGNEHDQFTLTKSPAIFPDGEQQWYNFLVSHIKANTARKAGLPAGKYTVGVQFIVDKEGKVGNVEVINHAPFCPSCDAEAVRVIKKSPRWKPAFQNGEAVRYIAFQGISFTVE